MRPAVQAHLARCKTRALVLQSEHRTKLGLDHFLLGTLHESIRETGCHSPTGSGDAGGHTVAVLAHGPHTVAASRHRQLADDIFTAGGALVSEYPIGHAVQRQQFLKRNRTQAGLSQGVGMVQSDLEGRSLHASRAALGYRRWLAVPCPTQVGRAQQEPKIG